MTKAFDTALFVPEPAPDLDQAPAVGIKGPPFDTVWDYIVKAPGPGITLGASIPAATDKELTLRSGAAPGFPWLAVPPYYLGALAAPPSTNPAPGAPTPAPLGSMYFDVNMRTPFVWDGVNWIPLPIGDVNAPQAKPIVVSASVPAATADGQMIIAGPRRNEGGRVVFPWDATQGPFLGAHPVPPLPAPGAPHNPIGSFYYDTTTGKVYVWDGSGWMSIPTPSKAAVASLYYLSVAGQTTYDTKINDLFGQTHTFDPATVEGIEVYLNGVRLTPDGGAVAGDYTFDLTTSVLTLTSPVALDSILAIDILEDPINLSPTIVLLEKINPFALDGTTTTFPMILSTGQAFSASNPVDLHVLVDGVEQEPGVDFALTPDGGSIIFAEAPSANSACWVIYYAKSKTGFLTQVEHDGTLTGAGTVPSPLSVVPATTAQRGAVFVPGSIDTPPNALSVNPVDGHLRMTVALQTQIQAGVDNINPVTSQTLRGVMGAPVSSLNTTAKTAVPAINELLVNVNTRVLRAGDTMTGPLIQAADPVNPLGTATKQYVDAAAALLQLQKVNRAGDTMTGPLIQSADPVAPLGTATKQYVDAADILRVLKAGDTMTGPLIQAADPVAPLGTATKQYVDSSIAARALYQGIWQVAANVPNLTPAVAQPLNGYSWTAQTANPAVPEIAPGGLPGITGSTINSGDVIEWNAGLGLYQIVTGSSLSIIQADTRYVNITGDTMTGALVLAADPASALQAATKQYVDNNDLLNVKKTGDTMTGQLVTIAPVAAGNAANKGYVDAADLLNVKKAGDTMTGPLIQAADPVNVLGTATKQYVDAAALLLETEKVNRAGDTMTGALVIGPHLAGFGGALVLDHTTLVNNPNAIVGKTGGLNRWSMYLGSNQAETGANAGSNFALYRWNDAGGGPNQVLGFDRDTGRQTAVINSTGNITLVTPAVLTLAADPAAALQAATKQYVDNAIASSNLFQGNWQVAANIPDLTPAVANPQNGYQWTAQTVDPLIPETALASLPGIGGQLINNGDKITWSTVGSTYNVIPAGGMTQAQADTRYLQLTGGALTGYLTLNADPTVPTGAATKNYVDVLSANAVQKTGDTMTGMLNLPLVDPTLPAEATNKQYVDQTIANNALYQGIWTVTTNVPDLRVPPMVPFNGYSWIAQTVDPLVPDLTTVALPGIPLGTSIDSGWTIRYNGNTLLYEVIKGPNISLTTAATQFVDIVGDTMTGNLTFNGTNLGVTFTGGSGIYSWTDKGLTLREGTNGTQPRIIDNNGANARDILDTIDGNARYVNKTGDTMSGGLLFGSTAQASQDDTSRHITLYGSGTSNTFGFSITGSTQNYLVSSTGATHRFRGGGTDFATITSGGIAVLGNGHVTTANDGYGLGLNGGAFVYKRSGGGVTIREHSGGTQPQIEDNNGTNQRDILDTINGDARYVNKAGDSMTGTLTINTGHDTSGIILKNNTNNTGSKGPFVDFHALSGNTTNTRLAQLSGEIAAGWYGYAYQGRFTCQIAAGGFTLVRAFYCGAGTNDANPSSYFAGDVYARNVKLTSDVALKTDVRSITREEAVKAFDALQPVRFRWKPTKVPNALAANGFVERPESNPERLEWGLLADDVERAATELVSIEKRDFSTDVDGNPVENPVIEDIKHYEIGGLLAVLISKIKAQDEEIAKLKELK